MHKIFTFVLLSFLGSNLFAQVHWETIVKADHIWSYLLGNSEAPGNWYINGFNDDAWNMARGSFGFGDEDDTTILNITHSLYIRHTFTVIDKSIIDNLLLDIDYDDAYITCETGDRILFLIDDDKPFNSWTKRMPI